MHKSTVATTAKPQHAQKQLNMDSTSSFSAPNQSKHTLQKTRMFSIKDVHAIFFNPKTVFWTNVGKILFYFIF